MQRLAIAWMFLRNPPILILDVATSAVDTETERAIRRSIAERAEGRAMLVIAHRFATIQNAARIVVVDRAGIVEPGAHRDLLRADGPYRRLHEAQFGPATAGSGPAMSESDAPTSRRDYAARTPRRRTGAGA